MQPTCQYRNWIRIQRRKMLADELQHQQAPTTCGTTGAKKTDEGVPGLVRFNGGSDHIEFERESTGGQLTAQPPMNALTPRLKSREQHATAAQAIRLPKFVSS
jgi:hypothetical protein